MTAAAQEPLEFVLWGYAPDATDESLLVSEHAGIKDRQHAERVKATLERDHGCTRIRIQELEPLGTAEDLADMFRKAVQA